MNSKVYPSPAEPWIMVEECWAIISEACIFHTESISQTQSESPPLFTNTYVGLCYLIISKVKYFTSIKLQWLFYWEITDIYHHTNLRCKAWWYDLHILWNHYHNRSSQHLSSRIDTTKREGKSFSPCDENSGFALNNFPIYHTAVLAIAIMLFSTSVSYNSLSWGWLWNSWNFIYLYR